MKSKQQAIWNLAPIATFNREEVEKRTKQFAEKWKSRFDYVEEPAVLAEALGEYEAWQHYYGVGGNELYYLGLRTSQDENDPKLKAQFNQAIDFANKREDEIRFFELAIAKIAPEHQKTFLYFPGLAPYQHWLEKLFMRAKYVLSEPEEKILSQKYTVSHYNWTQMTSGFLSKEVRQGKPFNELMSLMDSQKKSVRDSAAADINDIFAKHIETGEHEINSVLANKKIDDELRGYMRPDQSRHVSDDIDTETVDTLIETVSSRFDLSQRFYKLKAKLLKVKKLKYHERNIPLRSDTPQNYPWSRTVEMVRKVVGKLDPEFANILERFVKEGQIDVYPRKGKRGGAFCAHELLSQPTYILLNHTDKLRDVQTLAHELGHGINNELMRSKQNALNFGSPMATAEVASTFMEDFVLQELRDTAGELLRLPLMMAKLNDDISAIFRQVACYRFEQELHSEFRAKGYLSHVEIGKIFQKHMASYMGPAVEQSKGSENWWLYWSHIRTFFYVYSYASGLLISKSLQASVRKNAGFISNVKGFLESGMSDSPRNIFEKVGINIGDKRFWEQGLDEVEELLIQAENSW